MAIKGWKNAHGDLMRIRLEQRLAAMPFVVRSLNKNGSVSKMAPSEYDYAKTRDAADARAAELVRLNPGTRYIVEERQVAAQGGVQS